MNIEELIKLRDDVGAALADKAKGLQLQLRQLGNGDEPSKRGGVKGRKVPPKYRSKKNPKLTWAGRGATPVWMRDEMKAGKMKKDAFLIR
jgi:DNA-binding protein H-NS